jgi:hypothetical protein
VLGVQSLVTRCYRCTARSPAIQFYRITCSDMIHMGDSTHSRCAVSEIRHRCGGDQKVVQVGILDGRECGWYSSAPAPCTSTSDVTVFQRCLELRTPLHSPEQLELCSHRTLPATHTTPQRHHLRCRTAPYYPAMWDDEDNNPYGSFARHDSNTSDVTGLASPTACEDSRMNAEA